MSEPAIRTYHDFVLPSNVVSKLDVSRLVSEVERLDNDLTAAVVRESVKHGEHTPPVFSEQLIAFLSQNQLSLDDSHARSELIKQLRQLKDNVPVIHMTFAVTADPESLQQLAQWLRNEVDPQAVIAVGLQPSLVAGAYVRTPNHVHDMSLRSLFEKSRGVLVEELGGLRGSR